MNALTPARGRLVVGAVAVLLIGVAGGLVLARLQSPAPKPMATAKANPVRPVLYWYDPMVPGQHFDKPGKSPFMDMQLVPRYADETPGAGLRIDPAKLQNLGMRVVAVQSGSLATGITATGIVDFNQRDVAIVQARAAGFVQRVYARAPGDVIAAGAPLADLLVPEWGGAQAEFLAVRNTGDAALIQAARQRLILLGMPAAVVADVERTGRPHTIITVTAPTGGVIRTLGVRNGMSVSAGQTLAEVSGLGTVWLNAAVPEAQMAAVRTGQPAGATFAAFPNERFTGRVTAILPEAQAETRTLTVRVELPNRGGRLRPGMFANVELGAATRPALLAPSEAVIRTGRRTLVMLALDGGRFQPAEVRVGQEAGGQIEILAGLSEGEKVVASGQFLLDSEASLSGVQARPIAATSVPVPAAPALVETTGRVERLTPASVTISHAPAPQIGWPAMTMTFRVLDPALTQGLKAGDRVRFAFDQPKEGPTIRRISKVAGQ